MIADAAIVGAKRARARFIALTVFIVSLALGLRLLYVTATKVEFPIRGDSNQYVLYAWNLNHHGVFSTSMPDAAPAVSDNYRGPGYPLLIAGAMKSAAPFKLSLQPMSDANGYSVLVPQPDTWIRYVYFSQALLGAATVLLTILIARLWLSYNFSLLAGGLIALWPHLISFSGTLLGETLFGFMIALSLGLLCFAEKRHSAQWMSIAGLTFGFAYLVNPIVAMFPLLAGAILAWRSNLRLAGFLLAAFVILPIGWAVRASHLQEGSGMFARASENFVQGSWPQFLVAMNTRMSNSISQAIGNAVADEVRDVNANPMAGLQVVFDRMAQDPGYYLHWYLLEKPFLLWDWSIRVGWHDIYFLPVKDSPLERIPVLSLIKQTYIFLNPLIFALSALGAIWLVLRAIFHRHDFLFAPTLVAAFAIYVTLVHDVLQAEPRYAIAYRPEEALLMVMAVATIGCEVGRQIQKRCKVDLAV